MSWTNRLSRAELQRLRYRYRRPVAALLAGAAMLIAISVIRAPNEQAAATQAPALPAPTAGEVAVPVILKDATVASIVQVGDIIDVVSVARDAPAGDAGGTQRAAIVARRARVIESSAGTGGFMPMSTGLLVVAVDESTALAIAEASATSDLSVAVHPEPAATTYLK